MNRCNNIASSVAQRMVEEPHRNYPRSNQMHSALNHRTSDRQNRRPSACFFPIQAARRPFECKQRWPRFSLPPLSPFPYLDDKEAPFDDLKLVSRLTRSI